MRFVVQIETDGSVFSSDRGSPDDANYFRDTEVARILEVVVDRLKDAEQSGLLRDINGHTVGHFKYVEDD